MSSTTASKHTKNSGNKKKAKSDQKRVDKSNINSDLTSAVFERKTLIEKVFLISNVLGDLSKFNSEFTHVELRDFTTRLNKLNNPKDLLMYLDETCNLITQIIDKAYENERNPIGLCLVKPIGASNDGLCYHLSRETKDPLKIKLHQHSKKHRVEESIMWIDLSNETSKKEGYIIPGIPPLETRVVQFMMLVDIINRDKISKLCVSDTKTISEVKEDFDEETDDIPFDMI